MSPGIWTTNSIDADARYEAWRHALNQSHLEWDLERSPEGSFGAQIRQKVLDGVRVIDCHCDPCTGWRRRGELARSDDAYFGVLFELRGREVIRQGNREATLNAGDFVMWDSEREMEFRVLEPLHKLTLLIPKRRMKAFLGDAERYAGRVVHASDGADGIAAEALRRLRNDLPTIDHANAATVIDPVLSLLSATLAARHTIADIAPGHLDSFRNFCRYIDMNLSDSDLNPASVAAAFGVSLRYLHLIFAEQGTSFGRFLRRLRLSRCHRDLSQAPVRKTVTEIAFRWGFTDMAHFSRVFKAEFGVPPRAVKLKQSDALPMENLRALG